MTQSSNSCIPTNIECPWEKIIALLHELDKENGIKSVKQFEYCIMEHPTGKTIVQIREIFNAKGALGWELCESEYGCFIFKREKK